ncbi:hypothetical protein Ddc_00962 [Ditylenchus destructor]|nr:hypothetical protein Ddc_00962 [Ditylenchus destructor]
MVVERHGPKCICEICTCGRHQCPHDRNTSNIQLGHGTEVGSQFHRKEYAVASTAQRPQQSKIPHGELSIDNFGIDNGRTSGSQQTEFNRRHKSDYDLKQSAIDARQRFITSAALRKRGQNSQIELSRGEAPAHRTTYRNQTDAIDQMHNSHTYERAQLIRPPKNSEIFPTIARDQPLTSVNRSDYGEKRTERQEVRRPKSSDLWKTEGKIDKNSVSKSEYIAKKGERYQVERHREAGVLGVTNDDMSLYRQTSNLSDYGPKRTEKHMNGGDFEKTTVNRSEYTGAPGDRYDVKRHTSSEIWKTSGPLESSTVNRDDYSHTKGERFEMKRNKDSDMLKGSGTFARESTNLSDYKPKQVERSQPVRQGTSEIWKRSGKVESSTVSRSDYTATKGERFDVVRPKDAGALHSQGILTQIESSTKHDYQPKKGERLVARRPPTSEIWKNKGQIESKSVNRHDYSNTKGERFERRIPQDSQVLKGHGAFATDSIHKSEFVQKKAQWTSGIYINHETRIFDQTERA